MVPLVSVYPIVAVSADIDAVRIDLDTIRIGTIHDRS